MNELISSGSLSDNMLLAWNQRALFLYRRFEACKANPLIRSMYMDEWGIDFDYARQWINFWRLQLELDNQRAA
jgi:hypothetical protein